MTPSAIEPVVAFARLAWRDAFALRGRRESDERHLLEAEAWLCRAQDAIRDGGVSYGYLLRGGWRPAYPETSGYIATTFLRLARDRDAAYASRAARVLDWLLTIQKADGSFGNPRYGESGIVFDTGQILFGLVAGYETLGDIRFLDAARRAARWLVDVADEAGRWTRCEFRDTAHVYNTRTAWALLRFDAIEPDARRAAIARSNLDWAVVSQNDLGWFDHCAFSSGEPPFTHTIAYATRGLLEAGLLLDDPRYVEAARRCAVAVLGHLDDDGFLPSRIAVGGEASARSCCLTGNCQFAIVWARLRALAPGTDGDRFESGLIRATEFVIDCQDIAIDHPAVRGGIKGSQPVWGRYAPLTFPNWATKFFIDAMWQRKRLTE